MNTAPGLLITLLCFGVVVKENPEPLVRSMNENKVFRFAATLADSITHLRDGGHNLSAVMLTYTAIDQMSWLSVEPNKHSSKDFVTWVNDYMLSKNPLPCTAEELWLARNGILHMGTAEAAGHTTNPSLRKLVYVAGDAELIANNPAEYAVVRFEDLFGSFLAGVMWFTSDLQANTAKLEVAKRKMRMMLSDFGADS
ncbi:hypothetical protein [Stutzerimonas nitrititolerans]|uniref:hypothetical protein n=1 Tax=Stutzerimonas nitrititolerans TaxID=2482751 RepID=UPI0028ADE777|nr:hypothetical protein [Stutzerimonas nitrititolerans]